MLERVGVRANGRDNWRGDWNYIESRALSLSFPTMAIIAINDYSYSPMDG